jgi:putative dimethyl sulfoxide reductase chaperone
MAPSDLARTAIERSKLYGLLATVFRQEATIELIEHLRLPEMQQALKDAGADLSEAFPEPSLAEQVERLGIEYTYLFLGPGKHISPHESVQLKPGDGGLWGVETSVVKQFMQASGFELDEAYSGIPDHLGVELEFLGHLTAREAKAWEAGDLSTVRAALGWQKRFLADHLGKWAPHFCRQVEAKAETPFYAEFAKLLRGFLAAEKGDITNRLIAANEEMAQAAESC